MDITIQERKFSLRSEYDISFRGKNYYAVRKLFSFLADLQLRGESREELARVKGRFSLFRSKYDFLLSDGTAYHFWCEKIWKGVFVCEGNEEEFRLYRHKGLNYSIFQGDRQIAAFTKNRVVVGKGNEYDIQVNYDANVLVVICMVLSVNTSENDDQSASVKIDLGNIGPEERPFDESWEPN